MLSPRSVANFVGKIATFIAANFVKRPARPSGDLGQDDTDYRLFERLTGVAPNRRDAVCTPLLEHERTTGRPSHDRAGARGWHAPPLRYHRTIAVTWPGECELNHIMSSAHHILLERRGFCGWEKDGDIARNGTSSLSRRRDSSRGWTTP